MIVRDGPRFARVDQTFYGQLMARRFETFDGADDCSLTDVAS
jgi:hypothetical protein